MSKLIIATYNIQFSLNSKEIRKDILALVRRGVFVICMQEVVRYDKQKFLLDAILEDLGSDWKVIYNLGKKKTNQGMGNCILWNDKEIKLESEKKVLLPWSKSFLPHEIVFSLIAGGVTIPFQRRVIIGTFQLKGKRIRITNLHLDHNGGIRNRQKQLKYLMDIIKKENKMSFEIICGDLNSLDLSGSGKEYRLQKKIIGSDFHDASNNIIWTADLCNISLKYGVFMNFLIKHFHMRRKLDFIWTKNMKKIKCEAFPLNASDHRPLVAFLDL